VTSGEEPQPGLLPQGTGQPGERGRFACTGLLGRAVDQGARGLAAQLGPEQPERGLAIGSAARELPDQCATARAAGLALPE